MSQEEAFIGYSYNFKDICLIYPPLNKDIIKVGFSKFSMYISLLTQTEEDIIDVLTEKDPNISTEGINPFIYLSLISMVSPIIMDTVCESIGFFTHEKVKYIPQLQGFVIGDLNERRVINQENYFDFQNAIRSSVGDKEIEKPKENEDPRIKRFKALQRKRDRIKAKQSKNNAKEFITLLSSVCCMNCGITPLNVGDITFAALKTLIGRYGEKDAYETKVASMLAGAESKDNTYWIKDL